MTDLIEDTPAPDAIVRHAPETAVDIRPTDDGQPGVVGIRQGAVWVRADHPGPGVDLGHGAINILVRSGSALFDVGGGKGLVIAVRGELDVSAAGDRVLTARAGEALTFDTDGTLGPSGTVDAAELAHDPFVSLNLVLDALEGLHVDLRDPAPDRPVPTLGPAARPDPGGEVGPEPTAAAGDTDGDTPTGGAGTGAGEGAVEPSRPRGLRALRRGRRTAEADAVLAD